MSADTGLIVDQGLGIILEAAANKTAPQNLDLILFKNNYTIVGASTEANLTEANEAGYVRIQLTAGSWALSGTNPKSLAYAQQTFTITVAGTFYGSAIVQRTSGKLIAGANFGTPFVLPPGGSDIKVTPTLTLQRV